MEISRKECNLLIVSKINQAILKYPNQRFHQILQNLNIEIPNSDQFYEESSETIKRMNNENQRTS